MEDIKDGCEAPKDGAYVGGIFLEGAVWDSKNHCLEEAPARKLTDIMPPVSISNSFFPLGLISNFSVFSLLATFSNTVFTSLLTRLKRA